MLAIEGAEAKRWELIDRAIRGAGRPLVALPLPRTTIAPGWLDDGLVAFDGPRVAAVVGGALRCGESEQHLTLSELRDLRLPYPPLAERTQYIILRRSVYVGLGGFDPWLARFGDTAPLLDLMERALKAGWIVGHRDVRGLSASEGGRWAGWRIDWELGRARGALIAGRAGAMGPLWLARWGPGSVATGLWRGARDKGHARQRALATTGGFTVGFVQRAVERRPEPWPTEA